MARGIRWLVVFMLFLGGAVSYLDRAAFAIAAPLIAKDLSLSASQLGLAFSAFFLGYAAFCFVGGWASDKFGAYRVMTSAMLAWSIFCGLTAAAISLPVLLVIRLFFGMGEGPFCSTASKVVSNWFPRREQASGVGLANAGQPLGAALAGPVVGGLATLYDWRVSFVVIACIGLLWVACWLWLATDQPSQHKRVSARELAHIEQTEDTVAATDAHDGPQASTLFTPAILATALAFFGFSYVLYFFLSWFPTYLSSTYHLSLQKMSLLNVIPWIVGFVGLAGGGFLTDYLYRRTGRALYARKVVLVSSMTVAALSVGLACLATELAAAVTLSTLAVFAMYLSTNTYYAIVFDTAPKKRVGTTTGFVHMIANCAGIVGPALTGYLVEWTGSFVSAFVVTGLVAFSGALAVFIFVKAPPRAVPVPATLSAKSA
ncbi:MFS transporter [Achromobacter aloeverae]|uniref:MFS transporter n=1 Tax=Achromobacter aloeverae TaxID=1750518 RepID=A0A4V1MRD4_9BURK|nr:MFS transporter [Achromobacter aloeverae]RXN83346.1 MFS transporter [Achromobacter aloeverae]